MFRRFQYIYILHSAYLISSFGLVAFGFVFRFSDPLRFAFRHRLYIERGGDPDQADGDKFTALHFACNAGHRDVVKVLIEHRADVNARSHFQSTPLHFACEHGFVGIARRERGLPPTIVIILLSQEIDCFASDVRSMYDGTCTLFLLLISSILTCTGFIYI